MIQKEFMVDGKPLVFSENTVSFNGQEYSYDAMSSFGHRSGQSPAYIFTYNGKLSRLPYDPKDKDEMATIFKEIKERENIPVTKPKQESESGEKQSKIEGDGFRLIPPEEFELKIKSHPATPLPPQNETYQTYEAPTNYNAQPNAPKTPRQRTYKQKKPIYKRGWFILIIVLVAFCGAGAVISIPSDPSNAPTTTSSSSVGTRDNPANPLKGITIDNGYNKYYFKLDKVYRGQDAIDKINKLASWEETYESYYNEYVKSEGNDVALFIWTIKAISGFEKESMAGWHVMDETQAFDEKCTR